MGVNGLDYQLVDVQFAQGLSTRSNNKLAIPGKWAALDNLTLSVDGALQTRDGMASLSTLTGNGLATYDKELLVVTGSQVSSISTATTPASAEVRTGQIGYVNIAKKSVRRTTGTQDSQDCAYGAGLVCYVWRDQLISSSSYAKTINMTLIDEATGTVLIDSATLDSGAFTTCPRVVFSFDAFFVFYNVGGAITCNVVSTGAAPTVGAATLLVAAASVNNFDACGFGDGLASSVLVGYGSNDAVTSIFCVDVVRAGFVPSVAGVPIALITQAQLPIANLGGIACAAFSPFTKAGIFTSSIGATAMGGLAAVVIDTSGFITTAATQLDALVSATAAGSHVTAANVGTSTNLRVFRDFQNEWGTAALKTIRAVTVSPVLGVVAALRTIVNSSAYSIAAANASGPSGPWIAGKAFSDGISKTLLPVCVMENYSGLGANVVSFNQQNAFFVLDGTTGAVVGKALYGTFGFPGVAATPIISTPCSTPALPAGGVAIACLERTLLAFSAGTQASPSGICRLTLTPNATAAPIRGQLGPSTYLSGGSLSEYCGLEVVEHGFNLFPEGISVTVNAAAGNLTAGLHGVVAVYEWIDNAGQRHQSAPSTLVTFTSLGNDRVDVLIPSLQLTQKTGVTLVVYMTTAAGLTLYRVTATNNAFANTKAATFSTIQIGQAGVYPASDAQLSANELLYTQPNQAGTMLPNNAPGPCNVLAIHQNRLWLDAADAPGIYRYSQPLTAGVGLQFNETLGGTVPLDAGGLVGMVDMDEKMILFSARKIHAVVGTGPTGSGAYSNYSDPIEIQADTGCVEPRSILKMPGGVIFKALKGWHLLGRDLTVKYIGDAVKTWDANNVSSAVLLDDRKEARFSSTSGIQLIYSYLSDQWSTSSVPAIGDAPHDYGINDAMWWPTLGVYVHLSKRDGLNRDTPGVYLDAPGVVAARGITTVAQTMPLHLPALEGFQRVRWMYLTGNTYASPVPAGAVFTIEPFFDDGPTAAYSLAVPLSTALATTNPIADLRHKLRRQKCKSLSLRFTNTPTTTSGGIFSMQALTLQVGVKRGTNKLPAAQSVG